MADLKILACDQVLPSLPVLSKTNKALARCLERPSTNSNFLEVFSIQKFPRQRFCQRLKQYQSVILGCPHLPQPLTQAFF